MPQQDSIMTMHDDDSNSIINRHSPCIKQIRVHTISGILAFSNSRGMDTYLYAIAHQV